MYCGSAASEYPMWLNGAWEGEIQARNVIALASWLVALSTTGCDSVTTPADTAQLTKAVAQRSLTGSEAILNAYQVLLRAGVVQEAKEFAEWHGILQTDTGLVVTIDHSRQRSAAAQGNATTSNAMLTGIYFKYLYNFLLPKPDTSENRFEHTGYTEIDLNMTDVWVDKIEHWMNAEPFDEFYDKV
jgi:hypothetical protein